jgi:hypothetical protein
MLFDDDSARFGTKYESDSTRDVWWLSHQKTGSALQKWARMRAPRTARKRTEALQAKMAQQSESLLIAAWIAAGAAIIAVVVTILARIFPLH